METKRTQCTLSHKLLFQNSKFSIEVYLNKNTNKDEIVIVYDRLFTDWPIKYIDGLIRYDHPDRYPIKIKRMVNDFYNKI